MLLPTWTTLFSSCPNLSFGLFNESPMRHPDNHAKRDQGHQQKGQDEFGGQGHCTSTFICHFKARITTFWKLAAVQFLSCFIGSIQPSSGGPHSRISSARHCEYVRSQVFMENIMNYDIFQTCIWFDLSVQVCRKQSIRIQWGKPN